ncbi:hypothetical protein BCR32DRAFT_330223, partial [Anaeromyces robustus]
MTKAADEVATDTNNDGNNENTPSTNSNTQSETSTQNDTNAQSDTTAKTNTNANTNTDTNSNTSNGTTNSNSNNDTSPSKTDDKTSESTSVIETEDAQLDEIKNSNKTLDSCGTTSSQLGMFSFHRPVAKNVLVPYSNFTIIWYYNNIIYDSYNYPTSNITIGLYYEDDANSNSAGSWKSPVFERTLSMDQIEEGPTLTGNKRSFQYNWKIMYDDTGAKSTADFHQILRPNEKYKLRISGDGKDLQRNPDNCYSEGDIIPGITRPFYIAENSHIPLYANIVVPDTAYSHNIIKTLTQIILPIAIAFYYLFM